MSTQFLVTAKKHTPILIKCSVADKLLSNIPVPVVFFYKQEIPINKGNRVSHNPRLTGL